MVSGSWHRAAGRLPAHAAPRGAHGAANRANADLIKSQAKQAKANAKANLEAAKANAKTDLINRKAEAWQIAQGTKGQRDVDTALLKAERDRAKQARQQADADTHRLKVAADAANKHDRRAATYHEPTYYAPVARQGGGCTSTIWLLMAIAAALIGLYFCLCGCN